jgi:hypothetical protein
MHLFHFSTCFKQPRAHHQEHQLYQYNIWYVSHCVGDRLVCRSVTNFSTYILDSHLHRVTYQMLYWYNWYSWWWARGCSKHVGKWNKCIELYVKLVIYKCVKSQIISPDDYNVMMKHATHMNKWKIFSHKYAILLTQMIINITVKSSKVYGNMLQPKFQLFLRKYFT